MTESRRSVSGLNRVSTDTQGTAPRPAVTGDLSAMRAKNRVAPPPDSAIGGSASKKQANKAITVYISQEVYTRARLTYKATSSAEDDRNWSQFVEKALAGEIDRRQNQHNGGSPFGGVDAPLSPGRPLAE